MNAATPTVAKGLATASGRANVSDGVFWMRGCSLDQAFNSAGGPSAGLHLVELANSPSQLQYAVSILFNTVKEDWQASEEMERMRQSEVGRTQGRFKPLNSQYLLKQMVTIAWQVFCETKCKTW